MADLDDDATPELSFTYRVSDEVVQEAVAVGLSANVSTRGRCR